MCSQFGLNTSKEKLEELGIEVSSEVSRIESTFLPYQKAPVVVNHNQKIKLTPMNFSLVPSWSKESKVKFATHNARIETVLEKPTWKKPFISQHCLVPMSSFYESVYEGPHQGHVIQFQKENHELLLAAGIFDCWVNPETKEKLNSFSILTTEPDDFIKYYGHDRSPIFLENNYAMKWLKINEMSGEEQRDWLFNKLTRPSLSVSVVRPLKAGWEKRK